MTPPREPGDQVIATVAGLAGQMVQDAVARGFPGVNACILAVRCALDVLDYFGVPARPLPVTAHVLNGTALALVRERGSWPTGEEAAAWRQRGAYGVAIGYENPTAHDWPGHLVAVVADRLLLDPALVQAARPEHGIDIGPLVTASVTPAFLAGQGRLWVTDDGFGLYYDAYPDGRAYRRAPDWTDEKRRRAIVGPTIRAVRDVLGKVAAQPPIP